MPMAPSLVRREPFGSRLGRRCEDRCQLHVNFVQATKIFILTPSVTHAPPASGTLGFYTRRAKHATHAPLAYRTLGFCTRRAKRATHSPLASSSLGSHTWRACSWGASPSAQAAACRRPRAACSLGHVSASPVPPSWPAPYCKRLRAACSRARMRASFGTARDLPLLENPTVSHAFRHGRSM